MTAGTIAGTAGATSRRPEPATRSPRPEPAGRRHPAIRTVHGTWGCDMKHVREYPHASGTVRVIPSGRRKGSLASSASPVTGAQYARTTHSRPPVDEAA